MTETTQIDLQSAAATVTLSNLNCTTPEFGMATLSAVIRVRRPKTVTTDQPSVFVNGIESGTVSAMSTVPIPPDEELDTYNWEAMVDCPNSFNVQAKVKIFVPDLISSSIESTSCP